MSSDFDEFNGEFNHSLKGFKIPLKENVIGIACDTPAPPGTEDIALKQSNANTYLSPLATVYEAIKPKFEILPHSQPQSQSQSQSLMPATVLPINNVDNPKVKSSSLFTNPSADGLPDELTKLFRPFCCDLCSIKLNSSASARLHYESKNHDKKINAWLLIKTGEPAPKRKVIQVDKGPTGPNALHCDVCDLPLTSIQHAKQHYMGRKHNNVLAGRGKPGGSGYYDANNKWVRTSQIPEQDPNNRFSIGESFLKQNQLQNELTDFAEPSQSQSLIQSETIEVPDSILNLSPPPPPLAVDDAPFGNDLAIPTISATPITPAIPIISEESIAELSKYCEICDINVTSEMHMRLHLNGAKHAKKLRQLGEPPYTDAPDMLAQCIISAATTTATIKRKYPSIAKTTIISSTTATTTTNESTTNSDFSVFRTPSGQYYCQICDLSVTSEVTLNQHFSSKRHLRAVSQSKRK